MRETSLLQPYITQNLPTVNVCSAQQTRKLLNLKGILW